MRIAPPTALPLFRSPAQLRMLARILLDRGGATTRELQDASGMSAASLHRELERAEAAGLIAKDDSRRPFVYRPDTDSPLLSAITDLLEMTVGAEREIARVLAEIEGVRAAAIFGSRASATDRPRSDIDLLVIGEPDERQLRSTLRRLGKRLGRQIDLTLLRPKQLAELVRDENPFLATVLDRPRQDLIGNVDELVSQ